MSQHPSLRSSDKNKAHRSVLKRYERIKQLKEKDKWTEDDSVYGLPKVKILRFKIKKEKAVVAETVEGAAAPAVGAGAPVAPAGAKAGAKPAAAKPAADTKKEAKK